MDLEAIKKATLAFFKTYYAEHEKIPSVKLACKKIEGLYRNLFYLVFKDGVAEACRLSGIPEPEARIKATAKARGEKGKPPETPVLLEEEAQADEAEAALEVERKRKAALERVRKAEAERLRLEAMANPKKLLPYMKTLDPDITAPFFEICKSAGLTHRRAWSEAVKGFGRPWEEWKNTVYTEDQNGNQIDPDFDEYVEAVIESFVDKKRLKLALERHHGKTYRCECNVCELRYEYEDKGDYTLFTCPDGCVQPHGGVKSVYPCSVCGERGDRRNLAYDRSRGVLHCKTCGFEGGVQGSRLSPVGTKAGVFKNQIEELEEKAKSLNVKLNEIQRQINAGERKEQALVRRIKEKEKAHEKLSKTIAALSAEIEEKRREGVAERRRAGELKGENKRVEERREVFNAVAKFFMDPEMITGEQLANVVKTLSAAQKMRGQQGHVGEAVKMTVEVRDRLLMRIAKGRYSLTEKADERLKEQLARQQRKHEGEIKKLGVALDAEMRKRAEAELKLGEALQIVNSPMVRGIKGLIVQSLDEERIIASS